MSRPDHAPPLGALSRDDGDFHTARRSFGFWAIIFGLGITLWLAALENSVLTTASRAILTAIPLGEDWIWLTNSFFLTSAAFQPLLGQLANLFGRRWMTLSVVIVYIVGSAICGAATNGATLIAGRAVQGIGSGGILMSFEMVISDLVPLHYRGNYIAIVLLIYSVGTTTGPLIGGVIVDNSSWRWAFYINLPVGAVSLLILFRYLRVRYRRNTSIIERLRRVDIFGNAILIGGTTSMLIALTYAGTRYPWSSWQTLVPLLVGFASYFVFAAFVASPFAPLEPVIPPRLFNNRTSLVIAVNTFLFNAVVYWTIFFIPVYFQSVKLQSPTRAGVNIIPISLLGIPSAAAASAALSRWGKYKMIHLIGFALFTIGNGLFSLLNEDSPMGQWVGFMFIGPIGGGLLLNTQLPAFQAPASETDQAAATASWNFLRTLGSVWGVAIPAAIFGNRVAELIAEGRISNPAVAKLLLNGGAYQYASAEFVKSFQPADQVELRMVYRLAYRRVLIVAAAFSAFSWFLCLFERDIPLRKSLVTEYGLEDVQATGAKKNESIERTKQDTTCQN